MNTEQIAQSNIFFMVTTIAVIILTVLWVVVAILLIRILKNLERVSKKIQEEGQNIVADVTALRSGIKSSGKGALNVALAIISQVASQFTNTPKRKTRKKSE